MNDLVMIYKGKSVVVLNAAEIVNNTSDSLIQTGYLEQRMAESMRDLGMFEDLYHPVEAAR